MLVRAAKAHASTGVEGTGKTMNPESSKASVIYPVSNTNANAKRSTNSSIRSQTWSCSAGKESCLVINAAAAGLSEVSSQCFRACLHFNLHNNQLRKTAQGYFGRNLSGRVTVSAFTDHFFSYSLTAEAATSPSWSSFTTSEEKTSQNLLSLIKYIHIRLNGNSCQEVAT